MTTNETRILRQTLNVQCSLLEELAYKNSNDNLQHAVKSLREAIRRLGEYSYELEDARRLQTIAPFVNLTLLHYVVDVLGCNQFVALTSYTTKQTSNNEREPMETGTASVRGLHLADVRANGIDTTYGTGVVAFCWRVSEATAGLRRGWGMLGLT